MSMQRNAVPHASAIPLSAALELAARRTVAACTARARADVVMRMTFIESALGEVRQLAGALA